MLPRLKITLYLLFIIGLFFVRSCTVHIAVAAFVLLCAVMLLPFARMKGGILPISLFLLFTFLGNLFSPSGKILYSNEFLSITDEGLRLAGVRTLRVFSMIFAAKILTTVLSFDEIIEAASRMLAPLERVGIPVGDFFSVTGLTLKVFPALLGHLREKYREAAKKHGTKGFRERLRYTASLLMPVFVESIRSPERFFGPQGVSGPAGREKE
ncbi:MAG: energy-coupling factor transporter transmembrane protein EcfT [Nitrospirae bacterium]|nr:energy-coupling factor transporter transmembrane protein EcfT [Nitrospirota bacterium]